MINTGAPIECNCAEWFDAEGNDAPCKAVIGYGDKFYEDEDYGIVCSQCMLGLIFMDPRTHC